MFSSNVQPKRRIHARPTAWHCTCREPPGTYRLNGAQLTRCPVCGLARPDEPAARGSIEGDPPTYCGFAEITEGSDIMRKTLKRILDRLRTATNGRLRKPTSARGGLQQPQRMQALRAPARGRRTH